MPASRSSSWPVSASGCPAWSTRRTARSSTPSTSASRSAPRSGRSSPTGSGCGSASRTTSPSPSSAPRTRSTAGTPRRATTVVHDSVHDLAFLALGTGLAAGLLLEGRLRRGSTGGAGEIGHLTLVPDGLPCKCGQLGCLEQYASGSALDTAWPSRYGRPAPEELFAAAEAGDAARRRDPRPVRVGGRRRGADPRADLRRRARRHRRRCERAGPAAAAGGHGGARARGAGLAVPCARWDSRAG